MKNPKNLTVRQKKFLQGKRLNPENWRVIKNTSTEMVIINRLTEKTKTIKL